MATTILALFRDEGEAEAAMRAVREAGLGPAEIRVVKPGATQPPRFGAVAILGIVVGAAGCGLLGAAIGFVAGGFVPAIHALLPGRWILVLILTAAGVLTGGHAGMLISPALADRAPLYYQEEVEAGRTLVTVRAGAASAETARRILMEHGAFEASPLSPMRKAS